jgi:hypothetical protein
LDLKNRKYQKGCDKKLCRLGKLSVYLNNLFSIQKLLIQIILKEESDYGSSS